MNKSPRRDLEVFNLKEEDEIADIASGKQLRNFKSPSLDHQSVLKYELLECVSQVDNVSIKDGCSIPCVDVNAVGGNFNLDKAVSDSPLGTLEEKFDNKEKDCELEAAQQSNSICPENDTGSELDTHKYNGSVELDTNDTSDVIPSPEMNQMDIAPSGSPFSNESVDINSEADECMNESTPSSSASDIAEPESVSYSCIGSNHCIGNSYMDDTNMEVVLYPDYVIYQEKYYTGSKLTFSNCCIKINGSTACINQGAMNVEWAADDLIDINCQLFQSIGTIMMKVRVISSNADHSSNVNSASGIEELKIAVVDSNWSLRYKQITSLNVKYSDIWNIVLDTDEEVNENVLLGRRCYFPNFDGPFDEVIYPKGDPDAVSLSKRDVDLLQPDTFINDTVIDFYIKYLKTQIQEEKDRFHFFNSFFFRKLADMDKNPSSASDGKAAFLRVRKWTRKVNLFEKDYIFIPVNFNLHWSLIVICHPGEVVSFNDDDLDKSLKVPCILHMDSIKGSHSGLKNLLQSYLWEEWKERHLDRWEEDLSSRFFNMRFLPLALPQQENSFDCGLFVLHYLELFLAEAPANFNPFKLTKFSNFLNVDWFPPSEAYLKRTLIQRLIFELLENRNGESTTSHAGQGIEITLLSASSLDPQSFNHSGLVLRELFEPEATAGELVEQCQSFDQRSSGYRVNGSIYPIEEDAATETSEHFIYLTTDAKFQHVTPQTCEYPYLSRGCGAETCHRPEISPLEEHDKSESSSNTSSCSSDDSDDIGVVENCPAQNEAESSEEAKRYKKNFLSTKNLCFTEIVDSAASNLPLTAVVGSLLDSDIKCGSNKNGVLPSSCEETTITSLHQISDAVENEVSCDDVQMFNGMAPNICEEQAVKRRRVCESDSVGMTQESRL